MHTNLRHRPRTAASEPVSWQHPQVIRCTSKVEKSYSEAPSGDKALRFCRKVPSNNSQNILSLYSVPGPLPWALLIPGTSQRQGQSGYVFYKETKLRRGSEKLGFSAEDTQLNGDRSESTISWAWLHASCSIISRVQAKLQRGIGVRILHCQMLRGLPGREWERDIPGEKKSEGSGPRARESMASPESGLKFCSNKMNDNLVWAGFCWAQHGKRGR